MADALYGLLAEFDSAKGVLGAAKQIRAAGYRRTDAFSPFPVEGLSEALAKRPNVLPWLVFGAGLSGFLGGMVMQWFGSAVHYPLIVGGKPYFSWPAFIPIAFELTILASAGTAVIGMILLNGLPMPYHPVFHVPAFENASSHRFFLLIEARDPQFNAVKTQEFLKSLKPLEVHDVPA